MVVNEPLNKNPRLKLIVRQTSGNLPKLFGNKGLADNLEFKIPMVKSGYKFEVEFPIEIAPTVES